MQKDLKFNFSLLKKGIYIVKIKDLKINTLYKTNDGYKYIIKFNEGKVEYIGKNCFGTEPIAYFADSIISITFASFLIRHGHIHALKKQKNESIYRNITFNYRNTSNVYWSNKNS